MNHTSPKLRMIRKLILTFSLLTAAWISQADALVAPVINPPIPVADVTKPMLLNYSNEIVTVYFYGSPSNQTTHPASIDDNQCLNPNRLGFVIQPGGGVNFIIPNVAKQIRSVQIFYGKIDPITHDIADTTKSWKIIPSADRWSIAVLPS